MQKDEETNVQQPQIQEQVQPQTQTVVEQPQTPTQSRDELDNYYKELLEEDDNTQGTQANLNQTPYYRPEDLDFFKEMLNPDEFEYLLGKAAELNNPSKVEELVENNPEQAEAVIADNTPLDVEAKQAEDGGGDKEVDNEAVENFIEEHNNPNTPDPLVGDIKKGILGERSSPVEQPDAEQSKEIDFDSFIDSLDEGNAKAKETLAKYNQVMQNYPPEIANMLSDKIRNTFTNFSRGRIAQATNMGNRFSNAGELLNAEEGRTISSAEKDFWADRISKTLDDPEKLLRNSRGLNLQNPETRKYFEEKYGHDWVKKQDGYSLNRSLRNQNIAIAKNAFRYLDKLPFTSSEIGGSSDKPKSKYDLINDLINGRIDPKKVFTLPSTVNSRGRRVSSQMLARRQAAMDALKTLKENNEIRKYLQSRFADIVDVSEYWKIPKEDLLTNIRKQIGGITERDEEAKELVSKDNEQEPKLDDRIEINALEQAEKEYKEEEKNDPGIDWDKVHIYEPGEDPIEWMNKDDYDPRVEENLNYDYEEGVGAPGVLKEKDEDFAGPDELPAQIYDNSDFQPKQLPAVINDGLPAEQYYEPVYDTSDYNFDWYYEDITPEQIDKQVDEDESIPEEEKEEEKEKRKKLLPKLKGRNLTASGSGHGVGSSFKPTYDTVNGSMSFGSGKGIMGSASIGNFMANPKWDKPKQEPVQEVKSEASKAPEPVETVAKSTPIGVKSNPTTSNRTSNGGFNSGGVNKTGNSLIKVNKVSLPSGEANNQPDIVAGGDGISQTNNLRDSRIQQLEARIKELDPELREHFGFSTKYKHVEYNETPIDECSGGQLEEIEEILDACGV